MFRELYRPFFAGKIDDTDDRAGSLSQYRGDGRTLYAPMEAVNGQWIADHIDGKTGKHTEHCGFRPAVAADDAHGTAGENVEDRSCDDDIPVIQRIGHDVIRRAEQAAEGLQESSQENAQRDTGYHQCGKTCRHSFLRFLPLALAEFQIHIAGCAVTDQQTDGDGQLRQRENHVCRAVAEIADAVSDEYLIDHVVKRVQNQRDHAGDGERYQQFPDFFMFVFLFKGFHICLLL